MAMPGKFYPKTSTDYARVLINEGTARQTLAEMGIDSRENLETAVSLYGNAQGNFTQNKRRLRWFVGKRG